MKEIEQIKNLDKKYLFVLASGISRNEIDRCKAEYGFTWEQTLDFIIKACISIMVPVNDYIC